MEAPRWLADEAALQALLHAVLDRFDRQAGEDRQRDVLLTAAVVVPDLLHSDVRADQLWHCIEDLQQRGVLKIRSPRQSKRDPYAAPWQDAKLAFAADIESLLRKWLKRPRLITVAQAWRQAVQHSQLFIEHAAWLQERPIVVTGRSAVEVLNALATAQDIAGPVTLRQLSARLFWGDSKLLDERAELIATLFPRLSIRERVMLVTVFLPERFDGVLFVENLDTYAAALEGRPTAVQALAIVYAAGFAASADRIRSRTGARLHYSGAGMMPHAPAFEHRWFGERPWDLPLHFWGDLDFAGMQILRTLRQRFGDVCAWRPGYEPMLARLRACGGYGGHDVAGKAQIDPVMTGCEFADHTLLPAIRQQGRWDQEGAGDVGPV